MLEGANIKISGTITDINGKSARNILEHILSGKQIDSAEYDILYEKKVIAHNLKASKEQIIDDLNGVMSDIQRKMMRLLLKHLDELNAIIKELDDDIDSFMKPQEKQAAKVIQAIDKGQSEAGRSLGLSYNDTMRFVVIRGKENVEWVEVSEEEAIDLDELEDRVEIVRLWGDFLTRRGFLPGG